MDAATCGMVPGMLLGCSQSKSSVCGALRHEDRHAAAAIVAAFQINNFDSFRVAPEAPACEYLCNVRNQHAAAATAAAFQSHDLYNSLEASEANASECLCNMRGARRDFGKVSSNWAGERQGSYKKTSKDLRNPQTFRL